MISKTTGIVLIAGIVLGVIASIAFMMLAPAGTAGDCTAILPPVAIGQTGSGSDMGTIPEFSSEEQAQKFLIAHTDTGRSTSGSRTATTAVSRAAGGGRTWSFDVDTSTFKPDEYIVTADAVMQNAHASALFNVLEQSPGSLPRQAWAGSSSGSGDEYYITIDPVSDHYIGDRFTITGTTNIPADGDLLVQVYSSSFKPTQKSQSGEFSGVTRTVKASASTWAAVPVATVAPVAAPTAVPSSAEDRRHSTTNVQVKEVDEADIVKTNGTYIYAVTGNTLRIINAYPADHAKIEATVKFSGSPRSLYLTGDRLVVISEESASREFWKCEKIGCTDASWSRPTTHIFVYGISDPAHPELVRQLTIDGSLSDSRMIDSYLYFITTSAAGTSSDANTFPQILDYAKGTQTPNVYYFDRMDKEFSYTTIGSFNTATTVPVKAKTFLIGSAGTVYVSPTHLYIGIATPTDDSGAVQTDIYAFTIENGKIAYAAQGTVNGALLNQYSLDESGGNLRLATTGIEGAGKYKGYFNTVYILDSSLKTIGSLKKIAPGQQISATRFVGNRLYLATDRGTDPLLVLDLSDPANIRVLGKLQLPGYAGYLHPYDESYMISIGKESNDWGLRIALFNVTNVSAPAVVDTIELGSRGSDSEVLRDPKAFLFDKDRDLLVLPVHLVGQSGTVAYKQYQPPEDAGVWGGAYVFSVGPSQGFHLKGTVGHYDSASGSYAPVKRSLYIEDILYTLSSDMVVMSDLKNGLALVNSLAL